MKLFGIPYEPGQLYRLAGDVLAALLAVRIAFLLRFGSSAEDSGVATIVEEAPWPALVFVFTALLPLYLADAYNPAVDFRRPLELVRLRLAVLGLFLAQVLLFFLFGYDGWGRGVAALASVTFGLLLTVWRPLVSWLGPGPVFRQRALLVGDRDAGHVMEDLLYSREDLRRAYEVVGSLTYPRFGQRRRGDDTDPSVPTSLHGVPVLGEIGDVRRVVEERQIDLVIVAVRGALNGGLTRALLGCKSRGVAVEEMATVYKRLTGKVPVLQLSDSWLLFGPVFAGSSRLGTTFSRLADITFSLIGIVLSAPFIVLAGIAIKLESSGPVFYRQERLGHNEAPFQIIKLRTMREDAEAKSGPVWATKGDARITRVGRWLGPVTE